MSDSTLLAAGLGARFGARWHVEDAGASSYCASWKACSSDRSLFLKTVAALDEHVLTAEEDGLRALRATSTIRVPHVVDCWRLEHLTVLAMEWLDFGVPNESFGARFGESLARLHAVRIEGARTFGWHRANLLGATPQENGWSNDGGLSGWIDFLERRRLGVMRARLVATGTRASVMDCIERVIDALPEMFKDGHEPRPSLIHGDLWSGNWGALGDATPVIYDPAVSCSDAEAELAMMELFGGPPRNFWDAYRATMPVAEGYEWRRHLYQLYHLLNHMLLFGPAYERRCIACAQATLAAIGK
jgi:fructosamine-3-kinase